VKKKQTLDVGSITKFAVEGWSIRSAVDRLPVKRPHQPQRAKDKEVEASYDADAALREALFGNAVEARQRTAATLVLSNGRGVQFGAALALAFAGDTLRAQMLADDLDKRFPEDTVVQFNFLPTIHAQLAWEFARASSANTPPRRMASRTCSAFCCAAATCAGSG
jgi:hypothetical protein